MKRCTVLTKDALHYRKEAFRHGLEVHGYRHKEFINDPGPEDILVIWNRTFLGAEQAERFEQCGARVLVAENGLLGKKFLYGGWYSLAWGHIAGAGGHWADYGPQRWDSLDVELLPWHEAGNEVVILGQRGIGERSIKSPDQWAEKTQAKIGGRIRPHPGRYYTPVPIDEDLANASCAITWASSAALSALMYGVPVFHEHPSWVGAKAAKPLNEFGTEPRRDDAARLEVFRHLAWANWNLSEIDDGTAFAYLLGLK